MISGGGLRGTGGHAHFIETGRTPLGIQPAMRLAETARHPRVDGRYQAIDVASVATSNDWGPGCRPRTTNPRPVRPAKV